MLRPSFNGVKTSKKKILYSSYKNRSLFMGLKLARKPASHTQRETRRETNKSLSSRFRTRR